MLLKAFDLLNNRDEKPTCVLMMRHYSQAKLWKLAQNLLRVARRKHGLCELLVTFWYTLPVLICGKLFFLRVKGHYFPSVKTLVEHETW